MYRVLAVDDEQVIADSLFRFLKRFEDAEIEPFKAYSGSHAITIMETVRIDILIADVCMPRMDGFELLEYLRSNWPECRIIFITGNENFENAYRALQYEKVRFVLKACGYEKLAAVLQEVLKGAEEERSSRIRMQDMESHLNESRSVLQRDYLRSISSGLVRVSQTRFEELQLDLRTDLSVLPLVGRLDDVPNPYELDTIERIGVIINSFLETYGLFSRICDVGRLALWVIQARRLRSDKDLSNLPLQVREILPDIQRSCARISGKTISFAVSTKMQDWPDVPLMFNSLSSVLDCFGVHESELIVTDISWSSESQDGSRPGLELPVLETALQKLRMGLSFGNQDLVTRNLHNIAGLLPPETDMSDLRAMQAFTAVGSLLINHLCAIRYLDSVMEASFIMPLTGPRVHRNWGQACASVMEICERITAVQAEQHDIKSERTVKRIKLFIHEHLDEDLSLTRLADIVQLNPSYLSRFFKSATGLTIGKFIRDHRINRAKELLESTSLTVAEVAFQVGFSSGKYFANIFKQSTGFQPHQWRDGIER